MLSGIQVGAVLQGLLSTVPHCAISSHVRIAGLNPRALLTEDDRVVEWLVTVHEHPGDVKHNTNSHAVAVSSSVTVLMRTSWTEHHVPRNVAIRCLVVAREHSLGSTGRGER